MSYPPQGAVTRPISPPLELTELVDAVCSETEAAALAALAKDYPMKLEPDLERWVLPGWHWTASATRALYTNAIIYIPIFVEKTTTYIRIGIKVITAEAGTADLRIFEWENGLPTNLILSAGTVDLGSTGTKEITISQELTRGYYFLAFKSTSAAPVACPDINSAISTPVAGLDAALTVNLQDALLGVVAEYADPAPAPALLVNVDRAVIQLREN